MPGVVWKYVNESRDKAISKLYSGVAELYHSFRQRYLDTLLNTVRVFQRMHLFWRLKVLRYSILKAFVYWTLCGVEARNVCRHYESTFIKLLAKNSWRRISTLWGSSGSYMLSLDSVGRIVIQHRRAPRKYPRKNLRPVVSTGLFAQFSNQEYPIQTNMRIIFPCFALYIQKTKEESTSFFETTQMIMSDQCDPPL